MPPKIPMPDPTPGQEKFLFKLSRMVPEMFLITQLNKQLRVGTMMQVAGKRGAVRLLFMDCQKDDPTHHVGAVIAWEDGSITVPAAVLDFLADQMDSKKPRRTRGENLLHGRRAPGLQSLEQTDD